jgi:Aromatic amino acid lyase
VSVRATPHIVGALRQPLADARGHVEREANASTSNPLVFAKASGGHEFVMGGNWDAALLGREIDSLYREAVQIATWVASPPQLDATSRSRPLDAASQEQAVGNVAVGDGSGLPDLGGDAGQVEQTGYEPQQQDLSIYRGYCVLDVNTCIRNASTLLAWVPRT